MKVSEADDPFAKPFVEQMGRDNVKAYWNGLDPDHFGHGRESHEPTKE